MELRSYLSYRRIKKKLTYWRTRTGFEVDFLIGSSAAIEVKSTVTSSQIKKTVDIHAPLRNQINQCGLFSIYAWGGISLMKSLEVLWEFVKENPTKDLDFMPDVVYVRGKYILIANRDGVRHSPPYHCWEIKKNGISEGEALLGLVGSFWKFGLQTVLPGWLLGLRQLWGVVAGKLHVFR